MSTNPIQKVTCIGLGKLGKELAGRLTTIQNHPCKFDVSVWNRTTSKAVEFTKEYNVPHHLHLGEAVLNADVILSCVNTTDGILEIITNAVSQIESIGKLDEFSNKQRLWVDCTSGCGDSERLKPLLQKMEDNKFKYVDCAVSGGPHGARAGVLTAMVGGPDEYVDVAMPVLSAFAKNINHLGPNGAGHAVKAVNNTLLCTNLVATSEAFVGLAKHGIHPTAALQAINTSSGRSFVMDKRYPENIFTRKFNYGFTLENLIKDCNNGLKILNKGGEMNAPLLTKATELAKEAMNILDNEADHVEVIKLAEERCAAQGILSFDPIPERAPSPQRDTEQGEQRSAYA